MVEGKIVFANVDILEIRGSLPSHFESLTCDSREVHPGALFVALKGENFDGHQFLPQVHEQGGQAAVVQQWTEPSSLPQIRVKDTLASLPRLAANFYGHPSQKLHLTGITGSNGKTTTCYLLEHLWHHAGQEAALIGTIEYRYKGQRLEAPHTTPLPHAMHKLLADIVEAGNTHVFMEVSSHGLVLHRVDEMEFDEAIFMNLSRDHLDFHSTMEEYYQAKKRLFSHYLKPDGMAVINLDDEAGQRLTKEIPNKQIVTFATQKAADVVAHNIQLHIDGTTFDLQLPHEHCTIHTQLVGLHNVENILAAAALAHARGLFLSQIKEGIETFSSVPGRLESIPNSIGANVVVDYCHTPDALEKCLRALKALPHKRLITLFGCGGDRDTTKRAPMGEIALRYSDFILVTNDNPRREDPLRILQDIQQGMQSSPEKYTVIPDRRAAIRRGIEILQAGDVLLIAGKGHETYQLVGHKKIPFDDRQIARDFLEDMGKGE